MEKTQQEIDLHRDDSVPGLLKELDAFINHPDQHEETMASFDQKYCKKYAGGGDDASIGGGEDFSTPAK